MKTVFLNNFKPLLFAFLIISLFVVLPHALTEIVSDAAVFIYMGEGIKSGEVPYVDMIDMKPPIIFFISAIISYLPGSYRIWISVLEIIAMMLAGYIIIHNFHRKRTKWMIAIVYSGMLLLLSTHAHRSEYYALPFQASSLLMIIKILEDGKGNVLKAFFVGIGFAFTFLLRQNLIGVWIAGFALIIKLRITSRSWKKLGLELATSIAGMLFVIAPLFLYLSLNSALDDFWRESFLASFSYSATRTISTRVGTLSEVIQRFPWFVIAGGIIVSVGILKKSQSNNSIWWEYLIYLFSIEFILANLSGWGWSHYFVPLFLPTSIITAFAIDFLVAKMKEEKDKRLVTFTTIVCLSIFALPGMYNQLIVIKSNFVDNQSNKLKEVVSQLSYEKKGLFVWGYSPEAYLWSNMRSPSPYFHQYPIIIEDYPTKKTIKKIVEDLSLNPPRYIIDGKYRELFPPLMRSEQKEWINIDSFMEDVRFRENLVEEVDPIAHFVESRYAIKNKQPTFILFELIESSY